MTSVRVFVCGSPDRGDDAVAIRAIDGLDPRSHALAEIDVCGTLGVEDLVDVPSGTRCLVLDAAVGVEPGSIVTGTLASLAHRARSAGPAPHSSHILPIHETLALAEAIRGSLPEGSFLGIGSASFDFGEPLSPAVQAALPQFRAAIAAEIDRLAAPSLPPDAGAHPDAEAHGGPVPARQLSDAPPGSGASADPIAEPGT